MQRGMHWSQVVRVRICSFLDRRVLDESPCRDVGSVTPYSWFIWEFLLAWLPAYRLHSSHWDCVPGNASYLLLKNHSAVGSNCSDVVSIFRNLYLMSASSLRILLHHCLWVWKAPSLPHDLLDIQIPIYSRSNQLSNHMAAWVFQPLFPFVTFFGNVVHIWFWVLFVWFFKPFNVDSKTECILTAALPLLCRSKIIFYFCFEAPFLLCMRS